MTIAHMTFSMAYVTVIVNSRLATFDTALEEAAMDLGARPVKVFFVITLPIIFPAILSGWLLAFTLSWDDLVISSFTSGPGSSTLPMVVFSKVRLGVSPEINVLATLTLGVVGAMIVGREPVDVAARQARQSSRLDFPHDALVYSHNWTGRGGWLDGFSYWALAALVTLAASSAENGERSVTAAAAASPPATPTIVMGASTIVADTTTTVSWNSTGASDCTAGGNANALQTGWHGVLAISGNYTVAPISVGSSTYTCSAPMPRGNPRRQARPSSPRPRPSTAASARSTPGRCGTGLAVVLLRRRMLRTPG